MDPHAQTEGLSGDPAGQMSPSALLAAIGQALYGENFRGALAIDLEVRPDTVRHWASGKSRIPLTLWGELLELLRARERALPALIAAAMRFPAVLPNDTMGNGTSHT